MEYDVEKISNKIKNKKNTKKLIKHITLFVLIILFIFNLILSFEENTHILGVYMFNIVSESMEPTFFKNDLVVVKKCTSAEELQKNDIITFKQNEKTISHRIYAVTKEKGEIRYITKGDNNNIQDKDTVKFENVYGKVVFSVKKIGIIIQYIQNSRGLLNVIIFIVIVYVLISLRDNHKNSRKLKRKKYEIKKIRDNYQM